MHKVIVFLNWFVIGLLALFVIILWLDPNRGGDAATKGLGSAFITLGLIVIAVLVVLNLLPWQWTKYVAFCLVALPFLIYGGLRALQANKRAAEARLEAAKPIFDDPNQDKMAHLVRDGKARALKKLLPSMPAEAIQAEELLRFAIEDASYGSKRREEKLECVKMLAEAGAPIKALLKKDEAILYTAIEYENFDMLRFLFEQGADPNMRYDSIGGRFFDAIRYSRFNLSGFMLFIEFGADINATAVFDKKDGPITPLIHGAEHDCWKTCSELIKRGANVDFKTPSGKSCASIVEKTAESVHQYNSQEIVADFEELRALLHR